MTFREALTSAGDVDTRLTPTGAGARMYTDNSDPASPRGVVELSDGFFGDTPATLTQHSVANTRAEDASLTGGVTLAAGSYGGGAAPSLALDLVQAASDGSLYPQASLTAPLAVAAGTVPAFKSTEVNISNVAAGSVPPGFQPIIRSGTFVGTVNAASFINVPFTALPNGVFTVSLTPGDIVGSLGQLAISGYALNQVTVRCLTAAGANLASGTTVRINFLVIGW